MTTTHFWEVQAQEGYIMTTGTVEQIREEVEEKLQDLLGFFIMLEASDDNEDEEGNDVVHLYLHTDNEEDRTEEEIKKMEELGLNLYDTEENQHQAICRILGITITK